MPMKMRYWLNTVKGFLKTPQCSDCRITLQFAFERFCPVCRGILKQRPWQAIADTSTDIPLYAACDFNRIFKKQLYGYKYYGETHGQRWLLDLLIDYCRQDTSSVSPQRTLIVTIPPREEADDPKRLTRLADSLSDSLGYQVSVSFLRWKRSNKPQHLVLSRKARFTNMMDTFSLEGVTFDSIDRMIILDDLITTGATISAAAQAIQAEAEAQGASVVIEGLALARVPFISFPEGLSLEETTMPPKQLATVSNTRSGSY
jgi:predicted amidophosphoribosyltransferase